mgnify:CR=1 FL=1
MDQASYKTAKIVQDFVEDLIDGKKKVSDIENMKTDLPGDVEGVLQIDLRRIAEKNRGEKKMKKEEFLKVISEKDNDQDVNELIGEIEEHVFRYIKYGTRSNVFNLVETCYDDVKSMIVSETLKNYSVGRFMDLTYFVALCDLYFKNKSVLSERHDFEKALKDRRELAAIISFIVEKKTHVTLEDLCSHFEKDLTKIRSKIVFFDLISIFPFG